MGEVTVADRVGLSGDVSQACPRTTSATRSPATPAAMDSVNSSSPAEGVTPDGLTQYERQQAPGQSLSWCRSVVGSQ
jgi:hypothetical protein